MTTEPSSESAAKKSIQKLQRAIVDGLEDVKAQDIQVFNTEHLSPLFERVVVASGTSNRQTKALATSVRDAVRHAGFPKPRVEGEEVGEWIIVDCGPAVVHIMQPVIRQYYRLEELWGEKPIRLKFGADKPHLPVRKSEPKESKPVSSLKRSSASKKGQAQAFPSKKAVAKASGKSAAKKTTSRSIAAKGEGKVAGKQAPLKVVKVNAPQNKNKSRPAAKKSAVKK